MQINPVLRPAALAALAALVGIVSIAACQATTTANTSDLYAPTSIVDAPGTSVDAGDVLSPADGTVSETESEEAPEPNPVAITSAVNAPPKSTTAVSGPEAERAAKTTAYIDQARILSAGELTTPSAAIGFAKSTCGAIMAAADTGSADPVQDVADAALRAGPTGAELVRVAAAFRCPNLM